MRVLVFNAGSSSLKFDLMDVSAGAAAPRPVKAGSFVAAADGSGRFELRTAAPTKPPSAPIRTLAEAAGFVLDWLSNAAEQGRDLLADVDASVHRIVHGGNVFRATTLLGTEELASLAELSVLAPLHNPPALSVIAAVRAKLGAQVPLIGVFDTAYYADLPEAAYSYALPARWREEFGVRRYGFHGIAHRNLCEVARTRLKGMRSTARIVSLQLGRGCSVTATLGSRAIAKSMGFTPLEGLVMGTRSGDLDPGALLYVMERKGLSAAQISRDLNEASGLLGLAGTADMRELLALEQKADPGAVLAVEVFCRRARHYLGAYLAELGGADVIVFGGGIGENSPPIRRRILEGFEWAGIRMDAEANAAAVDVAADIASSGSGVAIQVIPVDEANVIASEAAALLGAGPEHLGAPVS
jgi:acetate kinase